MSSKSFFQNNENLFIIDGCLGNAIFILTTGTILSGYAYLLGANESTISIIVMLPTLMNAVQIFSARVFQRRSRNKRLLVVSIFLHRFGLGCMFMLPFINIPAEYKVFMLGVSYGIAYFFYGFVSTGFGDWMLHLVDERKVGKFLGVKDSLSLLALTITSLIAGKMLDYYENMGREDIGFLIVGIIVMVMAIMNYLDVKRIDEVETSVQEIKSNIIQDLITPFRDKKFRKVIVFYAFWNIALYMANSFYAIYMVGYLNLSYFFIMFVNMLSCISRVIASIAWGRLADRISCLWVNRCSVVILGLSICSWIFVGNSNYMWILPINQIMAGIAWGGLAITVFNIQFMMAPMDNKVLYVSVNTAITSIIGFGATLVGVQLLEAFPTMIVGELTIYGIQWVMLLSGVLMFFVVMYSKLILEKLS